jgi:HAD superfamily hydrolase (TIGR01509 family)
VIWDFDGSLCDTEPLHYAAYRDAFAMHGHEVKESEYYERFTQNADGIRLECLAYGLELNHAEIFAQKKRNYRTRIENGEAKPFPEIEEILTRMRQLNLQWAIASNSAVQDIDLILSKLGSVFQDVAAVVGPSEKLAKKPSPDLFIESMRRFALSAAEALVIEDTEKGLQASLGAGIDALCVSTRYNCGLKIAAPYVMRCSHKQLNEILKHALEKAEV